MIAADHAIVTAFEELKMTPEQIAETEDLELSAVKACLMQFSALYKNQLLGLVNSSSDNNSLDFQDSELIEANKVIIDLLRYSEDDRLKGKLAMYIRDDKKGRLDARQALLNDFNGNLNVNVVVFNDRLKKAKEARQRAIVDVESSTVEQPSKELQVA